MKEQQETLTEQETLKKQDAFTEQTGILLGWLDGTRAESERGRECRDMILIFRMLGCSFSTILCDVRSYWSSADKTSKNGG
jgi:hypothetical protein